MVFASSEFLFLFFPLVFLVNLLLTPKLSNAWLLISSLFFYGIGEPNLFFVFFTMIVVNYVFGLLIDWNPKRKPDRARGNRLPFILSIAANLCILIYYKYTGFFLDMTNGVLVQMGIVPLTVAKVVMPIGISFFTFQTMSYLIDLYWRKVAVQKNPFYLALYISLFPQLVAGPIVRYADVEHEIKHRSVSREDYFYGVKRFCVGLMKKVLIANVVARYADLTFGIAPASLHPLEAWLGMICYTLQIYFDFSAYSDMAIGMGRMMGFHFLENFNYPYIAATIQDFWRRWHMSLSTFFRDYVYIPLGGNRKWMMRTYFNSFVVFLLCGLWHGADWSFVVWGALHGTFLTLEKIPVIHRTMKKAPRWLLHAYTLLFVMLAWVVFRADTLRHAWQYIGALFGAFASTPKYLLYPQMSSVHLGICIVLGILFSTPIAHKLEQQSVLRFISNTSILLLAIWCLFVLTTSGYNPFIYFRF